MRKKKLVVALGGVFLCLVIWFWVTRSSGEPKIDEHRYYKVAYVVDGDTFAANIDGRVITVRMLGINTPETVDPRKPVECYGPEASNETKALLNGHLVRFAINPNRELKDRYGRYLLYVYRDDGLFVNEDLIKKGFAREYTYGKPYSMQAEFRSVEMLAKKSVVGLWTKCQIQ